MSGQLPLPTLLSQSLVAHTIEVDHLYETRMPHRTSESRDTPGPWLVSFVMWANFLRYVDDAGTSLRQLREDARITPKTLHVVLAGMERWGYVTVGPGKGDDRSVAPTAAGRLARTTWIPLPDEVDERWRRRFGDLRSGLCEVVTNADGFPRFLPIARYEAGLHVELVEDATQRALPRDLSIGELLARVLLAFTAEYEADSKVSLAVAANYLRVLSDEAAVVSDLPRATGTSKEAVSFATKYLARQGLAEFSSGRGSQVNLTAAGLEAKERYGRRLDAIEGNWRERAGDRVDSLRAALEPLVGDGTLVSSPLAAAVAPPPDTWRAKRDPPERLPHYPLVLHRGGYPDGS